MSEAYTDYETATGRILSSGTVFNLEFYPIPWGASRVLDLSNVQTQFVLDGRVVDRPEMPIRVEGLTVSCIPPNTILVMEDGSDVEVTSHTLHLNKSNNLDVFNLKLVNFPYLDYEVTI